MRLYVWAHFSPDYYDGLAFAIAETLEQAQELVTDKLAYDPPSWGDVQIFDLDSPIGFAVLGGS